MQAFDDVPQLYIDPVECIDCSACVPVCPVSAIFALDDLLSLFIKGASAYTGLLHPPQVVEISRNHDVSDGERQMLSNQRRYKRVPIRAQVACIGDARTMRGVSWNLSQGGMQVEVNDLKPKEAVQLSFRLPASGVAVDAVGAVVCLPVVPAAGYTFLSRSARLAPRSSYCVIPALARHL
jgi:ferredoxin